jgi:hypothetical protein
MKYIVYGLKAVIINNKRRKIPTNYKIGGVSFKSDNIFKNYPRDIFIKFSLCFAFFGYGA